MQEILELLDVATPGEIIISADTEIPEIRVNKTKASSLIDLTGSMKLNLSTKEKTLKSFKAQGQNYSLNKQERNLGQLSEKARPIVQTHRNKDIKVCRPVKIKTKTCNLNLNANKVNRLNVLCSRSFRLAAKVHKAEVRSGQEFRKVLAKALPDQTIILDFYQFDKPVQGLGKILASMEERLTLEAIVADQRKHKESWLKDGVLKQKFPTQDNSPLIYQKDQPVHTAGPAKLLCVEQQGLGEDSKLVPIISKTMAHLLITYLHLMYGHKSFCTLNQIARDSAACPAMNHICKQLSFNCNSSLLVNYKCFKSQTRIQYKGTRPFEIVQLDLWEDLTPINGFRHILLIHCLFSKLTLGIPQKSKTEREIVLN